MINIIKADFVCFPIICIVFKYYLEENIIRESCFNINEINGISVPVWIIFQYSKVALVK